MNSARRAAVAATLGIDVTRVVVGDARSGALHGTARVVAGDERLFLKWSDAPQPGLFAAEAAGLAALRDSGTTLVVPRVRGFRDGGPAENFLLLEEVRSGARGRDFDERLGAGLALLHRSSDPRGFGFPSDGYCGATPQPNAFLPRWLDFYRERRLGFQLALAEENGLAAGAAREVRRLLDGLEAWLGDDDAPPALIHGDLWSGNLLVAADGSPALIDPAAYFGHREAELGMMVLFGGFGERVFEAYEEAWALREGWRERLPLYSLYHVLNHFNLFGGEYGAQAGRIAKRLRVARE